MPNPNSEILDIRDGMSPLVPDHHAIWPESARPARRIANAVRSQAVRFLAWRARQATLRALSALDAATLRDLGTRAGRRDTLGLAPRNALDLTDSAKGAGRAAFRARSPRWPATSGVSARWVRSG